MTGFETLEIVRARLEELSAVKSFYYDLIDAMEGREYSPKWTKDVYPTEEDLRGHLAEGNLYLGYSEGQLAAAMVVNHDFNEGYEGVTWLTEGDEEEIWALHLLGVMPAYAGRGLGTAMVRRALAVVRGRGGRSLRLDVIKGNLPAERLYEAMGFRHVGQARLFYEDTGWADFVMMEYPLTPLALRPICPEDAAAAHTLFQTFPSENGFENHDFGISPEEFAARSVPWYMARSQGRELPEGYVPDTCFLLWEGEEAVGVFRVRHFLNDALREGAGHIGYAIRPDRRGRGYGTRGLALALEELKKLPDFRDEEIFLRCGVSNPASLAVMLANGGRIHHSDGQDHHVRIPRK